MVGVNAMTVSFGGRTLFEEISFIINKTDRIGLVGKNGAGKSTLLKILSGESKPTSGEVSFPKDFQIGYLSQDLDFVNDKTLFNEAKTAFAEIEAINKKLEKLNEELVSRTDYESDEYMQIIDEVSHLNERMAVLGGYNIEGEIEEILFGLGFERTDFDRMTEEFSGGWRMRIELAKLLLQKPDLLLLDEPTNHLDIESIEWLEQFISTYNGGVVLVSHDKTFLDNITNRTIEISLGKIHDYSAPYSKYLVLREERRAQLLGAYKNQQQQIKQTERFIERFRAKNTKASAVQSRVKQLNRMDKIELEEEDTSAMHFRFPPAPHSGKVSLKIENASKSYGDNLIIKDVEFSVERGDKIAFIGRNGEGKSTLVKMIMDETDYQGTIEKGYQVKVGYYAQNQADVADGSKTVLQTIEAAAHTEEARKNVRNYLGAFLFSGDDVEKKVSVLSGGERARVALCKLLLEPVNLLILDEPTNHLDIKSKEILKQALLNYDGTLILVSHDRDFLTGLTDKLYEFRNQRVKEHLGDVFDFLRKKKATSFSDIMKKENAKTSNNSNKESESKEVYEKKKELEKSIRKATSDVQRVEKEIEKKEEAQAELSKQLQNPEIFSSDPAKGNELLMLFNSGKKEVETLMSKWEKLNTELTKLEKEKESL